MNEDPMRDDDHYLWERTGTVDVEVARAEAILAPLRARPPALEAALGSPTAAAAAAPTRVRSIENPGRSLVAARGRWWPAAVAGVAVAASVLLVQYFGRERRDETRSVDPTGAVQPIVPAAPPSPDLRDPFGRTPAPPPTPDRQPDLRDPFAGRVETPAKPERPADPASDLKDPFRRGEPSATPTPPTPAPSPSQSDMVDPFGRDGGETIPSGKLVDPFGGSEPADPPSDSDLKDPFSR